MRKRRRRTSRSRRSSAPRSWLWLLSGVFLGVALGGFGYVQWLQKRPLSSPRVAIAAPTKRTTAPVAKPTYDFYKLLPETEVQRPSPAPATVAKAPQAKPKTIAPASNRYRLQLGAFSAYPQADALKAELAFQGFALEIEAVHTAQGDVLYRVQTPLLTPVQVADWQKKLKAQAIEGVVLTAQTGKGG